MSFILQVENETLSREIMHQFYPRSSQSQPDILFATRPHILLNIKSFSDGTNILNTHKGIAL